MIDLELFLYEAKPYIYLALGVYALSVDIPYTLGIASALILLFCGSFVLQVRFKNRQGASVESLVYQSLPFFYLALGIYVLIFQRESKIAVGCAMLLLFCATKIFRWRYENRHRPSETMPEKSDRES